MWSYHSRLHEKKNQAIPQIDHRYYNQNTQKDRLSTKLSIENSLLRGNRCCAVSRVVLTDGQREGGSVESVLKGLLLERMNSRFATSEDIAQQCGENFRFSDTVYPHVTGNLALNALAAESQAAQVVL